jgi:hypothetical protein
MFILEIIKIMKKTLVVADKYLVLRYENKAVIMV